LATASAAGVRTLPKLCEVDVEHHHDKEKQHCNGADIDNNENHRQELGAQKHKEGCSVEEGQDQEQDRVHGVPCTNDEQS
jgi:hypothetical protein